MRFPSKIFRTIAALAIAVPSAFAFDVADSTQQQPVAGAPKSDAPATGPHRRHHRRHRRHRRHHRRRTANPKGAVTGRTGG